MRPSAAMLCLLPLLACQIYHAGTRPLLKEGTKEQPPVLINAAFLSRTTARGNRLNDAKVVAALAGYGVRVSDSARTLLRVTVEDAGHAKHLAAFCLTLGILPHKKVDRFSVRIELIDRTSKAVLLSYGYEAHNSVYSGIGAALFSPAAFALSESGMSDSFTTEKSQAGFEALLIRAFFKDLRRDPRIQGVRRVLASNEMIPLKNIVILPFSGPGGKELTAAVEGILAEASVPIVTRRPEEIELILRELSFSRSGLVRSGPQLTKLAGANILITAEIREKQRKAVIDVQALDVETGRVVLRKTYESFGALTEQYAVIAVARNIGNDFKRVNVIFE